MLVFLKMFPAKSMSRIRYCLLKLTEFRSETIQIQKAGYLTFLKKKVQLAIKYHGKESATIRINRIQSLKHNIW